MNTNVPYYLSATLAGFLFAAVVWRVAQRGSEPPRPAAATARENARQPTTSRTTFADRPAPRGTASQEAVPSQTPPSPKFAADEAPQTKRPVAATSLAAADAVAEMPRPPRKEPLPTPPRPIERGNFSRRGWTLLARTGDAMPGVVGKAAFSRLTGPVINAAGEVAFAGSGEARGIWVFRDGALHSIQNSLEHAQGFDRSWPHIGMGSPVDGRVAFDMYLSDRGDLFAGGKYSGGILWSRGQDRRLLATEGQRLDGMAEEEGFQPWEDRLRIDADSRIWLAGGILESRRERAAGIWHGEPEHLKLVARSDQPAPGLPGQVFSLSGFGHVAPCGKGQMAMVAKFNNGAVRALDSDALWFGDPSSLAPLVKPNDQAQGLPDKVRIVDLNQPAVNGQGQIVIDGMVSGISGGKERGLWRYSGGKAELVAAPRLEAPGFGNSRLVFYQPMINSAGDIYFLGEVNLQARAGPLQGRIASLWRWSQGKLTSLVRCDQLPSQFAGYRSLGNSLAVNGQGQVILAPLDGLWHVDASGRIKSIVAKGQTLDFGQGDLRNVKQVTAPERTGGDDGRRRAFNDAGQLAFHVQFDDQSEAIFLVDTNLAE